MLTVFSASNYTGTVVVVSHDRVFMDRVTNRIIEIEHGALRTYPGSYSDYLAWKERLVTGDSDATDEPAAAPTRATEPMTKDERTRQYKERKALGRKRRALERQVESLEEQIKQHETRLDELQRQMADAALATDHDKLARLAGEQNRLGDEQRELLATWETVSNTLEALRQDDDSAG